MTKVLNTISAIGALVMAATPLLAICGVARAQDVQAQRIQVADLDLSRPSDVARFDARVNVAAGRMCASQSDMESNAACRRSIREEAVDKLDAARAQALRSVRSDDARALTVAAR